MADKVQKIYEEVVRLQNELIQEKEKGYGSDADDACILELQNVLTYIDSLQEEPKFNVGDTICNKELTVYIYHISEGKYWVKDVLDTFDFGYLEISNQDEWELVKKPVSGGFGRNM